MICFVDVLLFFSCLPVLHTPIIISQNIADYVSCLSVASSSTRSDHCARDPRQERWSFSCHRTFSWTSPDTVPTVQCPTIPYHKDIVHCLTVGWPDSRSFLITRHISSSCEGSMKTRIIGICSCILFYEAIDKFSTVMTFLSRLRGVKSSLAEILCKGSVAQCG